MNVSASILTAGLNDDRRASYIEQLDMHTSSHLSTFHEFSQRRASRNLYLSDLSDGQRRTSRNLYISDVIDSQSIRDRPALRDVTFDSLPTADKPRIRINVRGQTFETFTSTLERFPDTLLGSDGERVRFYDTINEELCFNRDPNSFDAILFYYQSGGILARPSSVDEELFDEEVKFFHLYVERDATVACESTSSIPDNLIPTIPPGETKREKLWKILERPPESHLGRLFARISWIVILLSVIAFCLETVQSLRNLSVVQTKAPPLQNQYNRFDQKNDTTRSPLTHTTPTSDLGTSHVSFWFFVDSIFVVFFTLEFTARVYSAPNRLKFIRSFLAIVDFCAIAPYYILHIANEGQFNSIKSFNVIRSIRLFRVIRLLKLSRYSSGLKLLGRALFASRGKMFSLCCCVLMAVVFYSGLLFYIESFLEVNTFSSIPDAFWFSIITMSTVGYGDVVPQSPPGKLVGAFCAFTGIILLYILPIPSFVTEFSELYKKWRRSKMRIKDKSGKRSRINLDVW